MPSHGYVPKCKRGHGLMSHGLMQPMRVMTGLNPNGELWWFCDTCGRVLKDVWN